MSLSLKHIIILLLLLQGCSPNERNNRDIPNIILIYLDDLGYGDVSAYNSGTLHTPNIDKLADSGVRFTQGYASSATCTPSRYALLTGIYPWRNQNARILSGMAPLLIDTTQLTLPGMLKTAGYRTGIVGKWHLGLGNGNINWNEKIEPGPNEIGFDYSFILAATQDRVPTVYIENGYVVNLDPEDPIEVSYESNFPGEPTGLENPELLSMKWHHGHNNSITNGIPRIGFMKGGTAARWIDEQMADTFLEKSQEFIDSQNERPFFLYYAMQQPHVPRTPHPRFQGVTGMGPRGDVIAEADWCIGDLVNFLESRGLLENTLIILTSDNGPVLNDGYYDQAVEKIGDHTPSGTFRGGKYSLYEAGTRVPFITYWKGETEPRVSDAMVSQLDLFSSLAKLAGSSARAPDSREILSTFLGKDTSGRTELIIEAGQRTALRTKDWVYIPPHNGSPLYENVNIESGNSPYEQLFFIKEDINQQNNLADTDTLQKERMKSKYLKLINNQNNL